MQYCHYLYFQNKVLKFQSNVHNRCHDLVMMPKNLNDIAILNIKGASYYCVISGLGRTEAINLMQNISLTKISGTL